MQTYYIIIIVVIIIIIIIIIITIIIIVVVVVVVIIIILLVCFCFVFCFFQTPCSSLPCQNGAKCVPNYSEDKYQCDCLPGYTGRHCETGLYMCISYFEFGKNVILYF